MEDKVIVSIICNTYNHEQYICEALDSFVFQKTCYGFEILVHDDASTDRTCMFIKEYEKKYPKIIKPIYQRVNQCSRGIEITSTFQYPRAKGKYIAFCEGDDFWTDFNKIQKCVDFLEKHEEYGAVFHSTTFHNCITGEESTIGLNSEVDCDYRFEDALNNYCHTSSFFFRKTLLMNKFKYMKPFSIAIDWPLKLMLSDNSRVYYFAKNMSLYRFASNCNATSYVYHFSNKKNKKITAIIWCCKIMFNFVKECSITNKKVARSKKYYFYKLLIDYGGRFFSFKKIDFWFYYILYLIKKIISF